MIFGRKGRATTDDIDPTDASDDAVELSADADEAAAVDAEADGADAGEPEDDATVDEETEDVFDARADGPFDGSEVDLAADEVERLALGPLTITPFEGMALQFQGDPESQKVYSALAMHENSALQIELFAAPTSGGLADELREDTIVEAQQAGGSTEVVAGPFGKEVKRVLPIEGPEGEQLFHVSRLWLVDGPRWVLRGTLMGQAALATGEEPPADVFAEFFRNVVVHRDDSPRVPGELLTLTLPELPAAEA